MKVNYGIKVAKHPTLIQGNYPALSSEPIASLNP